MAGLVFALRTFSATKGGNKKLAIERLPLYSAGKAIKPIDILAGLIGINGQQLIPLQLQVIKLFIIKNVCNEVFINWNNSSRE